MSTSSAVCWLPSTTSISPFPFQNSPQDPSPTTVASLLGVWPMACLAGTTRATVSGTPSPGCSRPSFCSSPRHPELFWITDSIGSDPRQKKIIILQIGSSTRLCSLYWVVGCSLPLGECFHWWRGWFSKVGWVLSKKIDNPVYSPVFQLVSYKV